MRGQVVRGSVLWGSTDARGRVLCCVSVRAWPEWWKGRLRIHISPRSGQSHLEGRDGWRWRGVCVAMTLKRFEYVRGFDAVVGEVRIRMTKGGRAQVHTETGEKTSRRR